MKTSKKEKRTIEHIREHYEIEKALASKLRNSNKVDRLKLYSSLYDELYRMVPNHPQVMRKYDYKASSKAVELQMKLLHQFLNPEINFLEIGSGSCMLSLEVAKYVKKVNAIDVSEEISKDLPPTENFEFILSDGCNIPITENSIDLAYSYQLIEHLHPDDAYEQMQNIYRVLAYNGSYICITTNRLSGPHDISKYFDNTATGFHIKEYTTYELYDLFQQCGFSKIFFYIGIKNLYFKFPIFSIKICENFIESLNTSLSKKMINMHPFKKILDTIIIVGIKTAK